MWYISLFPEWWTQGGEPLYRRFGKSLWWQRLGWWLWWWWWNSLGDKYWSTGSEAAPPLSLWASVRCEPSYRDNKHDLSFICICVNIFCICANIFCFCVNICAKIFIQSFTSAFHFLPILICYSIKLEFLFVLFWTKTHNINFYMSNCPNFVPNICVGRIFKNNKPKNWSK